MKNEPFSIEKLSGDVRGAIYELKAKDRLRVKFLTLLKGFARGGHSHPYPETFFMISGEVEFHLGTVEKEEKLTHYSGEIVHIPSGVPHYVIAISDSVFAELALWDRQYAAENYEPFRSIVTKSMSVNAGTKGRRL
jgi:quercetin dioxygenase-like cupin family protein